MEENKTRQTMTKQKTPEQDISTKDMPEQDTQKQNLPKQSPPRQDAPKQSAKKQPRLKQNGDKEQMSHHIGHRQRLRERFMKVGIDGLQEYELLELILFRAVPRADVKPLAKRLLSAFEDLAGVLSADEIALKTVKGITDNIILELKIIEGAACQVGRSKILNKMILSSWDALIQYCRASMADKKTEELRIIFLDKKNRVIADEMMGRGSVDHAPVYPREIMKRAIIHSATALILVHNHPSGDPTPSQADIEITKQVKKMAEGMGIILHDHLIIARQSEVSFRNLGLL